MNRFKFKIVTQTVLALSAAWFTAGCKSSFDAPSSAKTAGSTINEPSGAQPGTQAVSGGWMRGYRPRGTMGPSVSQGTNWVKPKLDQDQIREPSGAQPTAPQSSESSSEKNQPR